SGLDFSYIRSCNFYTCRRFATALRPPLARFEPRRQWHALLDEERAQSFVVGRVYAMQPLERLRVDRGQAATGAVQPVVNAPDGALERDMAAPERLRQHVQPGDVPVEAAKAVMQRAIRDFERLGRDRRRIEAEPAADVRGDGAGIRLEIVGEKHFQVLTEHRVPGPEVVDVEPVPEASRVHVMGAVAGTPFQRRVDELAKA